jgi:hypothetical protein
MGAVWLQLNGSEWRARTEADKDLKLLMFDKVDRVPRRYAATRCANLFAWRVRISSCRHGHARKSR